MDAIINFLEQYWGYTLIGGASFGSIITFVIVQIKLIIKDKCKNKDIDKVVNTSQTLCAEMQSNKSDQDKKIDTLLTQLSKQQQTIEERNEYFEKVQSAIFQALSYLAIASKLPTEDKIALQQKFASILTTKSTEYKQVLAGEVQTLKETLVSAKDDVENTIIPDAKKTIESTIEETKSLLDKYTGV